MNNQDKTALVIQYALLLAGQEDDYVDRSLGPIHLIKYVYLVDLFYARSHNGETFTGIPWRFHKFGPWSEEVYNIIEPALLSIDAEKSAFPSNYEGKEDWCRWSLNDDELLDSIARKLPTIVTASLGNYVHKYLKDTPNLLRIVYNTPPMRHAAPGEILDFHTVVQQSDSDEEEFTPALKLLSEKKKKRFKEKLRDIKEKRKHEELEKKSWIDSLIKPKNEPRYDEVYEEGIKWLESLAGEEMKEGTYSASFDDSIWKSSTRRMDDLP